MRQRDTETLRRAQRLQNEANSPGFLCVSVSRCRMVRMVRNEANFTLGKLLATDSYRGAVRSNEAKLGNTMRHRGIETKPIETGSRYVAGTLRVPSPV